MFTSKNRSLLLALGLLLILSLLATPATIAQDNPVVAKVDGNDLTQADLEVFLADQLAQLDLQRSKLLEDGLGPFVDEALLKRAAQEAGKSLDDYLAAEVDAKAEPVSPVDVDAFYEANKTRLRAQNKEQIAPQIKEYLEQNQLAQLRGTLVAKLKDEYKVEILMEPIRIALDDVGAVVKGPADAPVTIVEFSDFECPACKGFNPTLNQVVEKYGDEVRVVFRQLPLRSIHPRAQKAAEASLCARDQGKFWELHDAMFAQQRNLDIDGLKAMAAEVGIEAEGFATCLDSDQYAGQVQSDVTLAGRYGLNGTPSVFINGRIIAPGRVPSFGAMVEMIDDELERSKSK